MASCGSLLTSYRWEEDGNEGEEDVGARHLGGGDYMIAILLVSLYQSREMDISVYSSCKE